MFVALFFFVYFSNTLDKQMQDSIILLGASKNRGKTLKIDVFFLWKTPLKWMIWGYHYFWKHPFVMDCRLSPQELPK